MRPLGCCALDMSIGRGKLAVSISALAFDGAIVDNSDRQRGNNWQKGRHDGDSLAARSKKQCRWE